MLTKQEKEIMFRVLDTLEEEECANGSGFLMKCMEYIKDNLDKFEDVEEVASEVFSRYFDYHVHKMEYLEESIREEYKLKG
jgi:hypothetical protein